MTNNIVVSTPPHLKSKRTTKSIMLDVIISLIPAAVCGVLFFGWNALLLYAVGILSAVASEFVYFFIANGGFKNAADVCKKWYKQFDYTSVITALILVLIVPVTTNWYEIVVGEVIAIVIVKMLFGGTGKNFVNPAVVGRIVLFVSSFATVFTMAKIGTIMDSDFVTSSVKDSQTLVVGATFLSGNLLKVGEGFTANPNAISLLDLFLGTGVAGCLGETCKLALLIGYAYLVVRKVIKWWQPLLYIAVTGLTTVCLFNFDFAYFLPSILSGGLMFGAIFMATDYVTSPKGVYGQIVYYVCLGLLTAILRKVTHIEVVSFVILLMNLLVPLIDVYVVRKPFGYKKSTNKGAK